MSNNEIRRRLPPYISYRTFRNFVDRLRQGIPARVDRSYWNETLSGSTGTHLMTTLRFLGLIDAHGTPTSRLGRLASAKDDQRKEILREMAYEAYSFLLQGPLDFKTVTYAQLEEVFQNTFGPSTSDVSRKCIKFFVALASDAEIPLSPFIIKRFRPTRNSTGTKTTSKRRTRTNRDSIISQRLEQVARRGALDQMLVAKFPSFEPTWPNEVKLEWFKAFSELLKLGFARKAK